MTIRSNPLRVFFVGVFLLVVRIPRQRLQSSQSYVAAFNIQRFGAVRRLAGEQTSRSSAIPLFSSESDSANDSKHEEKDLQVSADDTNNRRKIRQRVKQLARNIVVKPITYAAPMPRAIASVLKDATLGAVDMAVEEVLSRRTNGYRSAGESRSPAAADSSEITDLSALIEEAFLPLEQSLQEMEDSLEQARKSMIAAKTNALSAVKAVQVAAIAQAEGAATAVAAAEEKVIFDIYASEHDVSSLKFEDVDYDESDMAPPFLDENQCLVPGEPIVRVEKAPENSRRIFAGVDVMAGVDDVWKILTNYAHLQDVVPNLVVNNVEEMYQGSAERALTVDSSKPEEIQCQELANKMKGARLKQVGGAKVAGINFSARTTLEVREWPQGLPDFAHFNDEIWEGKTRKQRANEYAKVKLQRYRFPRPFAVSSLPTRDISMQSVQDDDGEFRMYQGVWRMQPLPGCAPSGREAMRLTYAVEVSPRAYLPVQLIERRIVKDLCTNLEAIRDFVAQTAPV